MNAADKYLKKLSDKESDLIKELGIDKKALELAEEWIGKKDIISNRHQFAIAIQAYAKQQGEVPTDEEIEKAAKDYNLQTAFGGQSFQDGAKWMRQFKSAEQQKRIEESTERNMEVISDFIEH